MIFCTSNKIKIWSSLKIPLRIEGAFQTNFFFKFIYFMVHTQECFKCFSLSSVYFSVTFERFYFAKLHILVKKVQLKSLKGKQIIGTLSFIIIFTRKKYTGKKTDFKWKNLTPMIIRKSLGNYRSNQIFNVITRVLL